MVSVTMSSEEARLNWRDAVDTAHTGNPVVIERYNKPVVVMVSHTEWQAQQERLAELEKLALHTLLHRRAKEIIERNDANESWVSHEELLAKLEATHGPEFVAAIHDGEAIP